MERRREAKTQGRRRWLRLLPLFVAALLGTGGSLLWWQAARLPREALHLELAVVGDQVASRLSTWIDARIAIVEHFREAWPEAYAGNPGAFRHDATLFVNRFAGFRALNWLDADWVIRITVPARGNEAALNKDLHAHPSAAVATAIRAATATRAPVRTSASIPFLQGGRGFVIYAPVFDAGGSLLGFVDAVFDVSQLVDHALPEPELRRRFRFCLTEEDGSVAYASDDKPPGAWPLRTERAVRVVNRAWTLGIAPAPAVLAAASPWRQAPLLGGIWILAGAVAGLLHLAALRQRALQTRGSQIQALLESVGHGVFGLDLEGRCTWSNAAAVQSLGFESTDDLLGRPMHRLIHHSRPDGSAYAESDCPMAHAYRLGRRVVVDGEVFWKADGSELPVEYRAAPVSSDGQPVGAVVSFSDLTARRRAEKERAALEQQMQNAQRLESLGLLAGGVAHDFNNLLVGILGNADALAAEKPTGAGTPTALEGIRRAARRASTLCKQLLVYSGGGRSPQRPCDLNAVVREMAGLLEVSVTKSAVLRIELAQDLPGVEGDPSQLSQVVMNLITNASEALEARGGTIQVRTDVRACAEGALVDAYSRTPLRAGEYVLLEVDDDGCGMDEETLARVFDPFFSTKFTGRGLGLAATLGIVRAHRGAVEVESGPGPGTRFRVWLPSLGRPVRRREADPASLRKAAAQAPALTVLLVDDEEAVRRAASRILERLGHRPLLASSGEEALERLRQEATEVDCLILDLTMPGLGGSELLGALRSLGRELPVLVSSGYAAQDVLQRFERDGVAGFLAKPYGLTELREALSSLRP